MLGHRRELHQMASHPILTVLEQSQVSPPPATVTHRSLPLTFFDFLWLREPPVHYVFFYEFPLTKTQFIETIVPSLKHSLSITLQHFFPFVGKLVLFPTPKKPEIRCVEGDSVTVTFAECNLDFDYLTGNHPRECDRFYHVIPQLGQPDKTSDNVMIPVFAVQVTFFPNQGVSIGMTNHHALGDASTRFIFLKAWTLIAKSGNDESFLANGTLPSYDRFVGNTKFDESYLKYAKYDTITENYQLKTLSGPTDKVRATFILTRNVLNQLKKSVLTELLTVAYASSFTVACAYVWNCLATSHDDERQLFALPIDCRARVDPPVPANYFGNCISASFAMEQTAMLTGKEGFVNAAKLLGDSLHDTLTNGVILDTETAGKLFAGCPTTILGVGGTPKLKSYDIDFGWGKPKKVETISLDFNGSISMNACRESSGDLEIGVVLPANKMDIFVRTFQDGLRSYI